VPVRRFPIRIDRRSRVVLWVFGVRTGNAHVDLDGELHVSFGFYHLRTPVTNLAAWRIEGPWLWITAIGVRLSLRHRDVTFGGSNRGGVRVDFKEPVRWMFLRLPALYVTVEDLEGFAAALVEHGVPGEDARRRRGAISERRGHNADQVRQ
jgi:hypothetical protein